MISAATRLKLAVAFAEQPLRHLTPAELKRVRNVVAMFLLGGANPVRPGVLEGAPGLLYAAPPFAGHGPERLSVAELGRLQAAMRDLLRGIARPSPIKKRQRPGVLRGRVMAERTMPSPPVTTTVTSYTAPWGDGVVTALMYTPVRDGVLTILMDLLRHEPSDRILICPEARCQRLFVRHHEQYYCSPRCTDRANKREWREWKRRTDPSWRARENARKQAQYAPKRKRRTA